jgi:tetratricopeptide (TPR) repeat protein
MALLGAKAKAITPRLSPPLSAQPCVDASGNDFGGKCILRGMDANNPVVRLCAEGMNLERAGRRDAAAQVFAQAWEQCTDDCERCIAAHYVARAQTTPEDNLRWNLEALEYADAIHDGRVHGFYPSLYLNIGWAWEDLGKRDEARKYYELAAARLDSVPEGAYRETVRDGIDRGLQRVTGASAEQNP